MVKPGFTLLEMLVSVAIFSGLVILILAIFVRTASSQARVNVLREKSEVARSAMAQVTGDFQYLYLEKTITLVDLDDSNQLLKGFHLINKAGFDGVGMVLRYPNKTDSQLVYKRYQTENTGRGSRSRSLTVREFRDCRLAPADTLDLQQCGDYSNSIGYRTVLPTGFLLDDQPVFTGLEPENKSLLTGFLRVAYNIKPADLANTLCQNANGSCYKVETILTAGGVH